MYLGDCLTTAILAQPTEITQFIFGQPLSGKVTQRTERIHAVRKDAGIDAVLSENIEGARWQKFIGLVAASGLCALTRRPIGDIRHDPDLGPLLDDMMREVIDVGRSCGVQLAPDVLRTIRAMMIDRFPPHAMPSMAVDLRAGNRLELPWLAGKVVQLGAANGVPTPINRVVYAALKPYINGPPT